MFLFLATPNLVSLGSWHIPHIHTSTLDAAELLFFVHLETDF